MELNQYGPFASLLIPSSEDPPAYLSLLECRGRAGQMALDRVELALAHPDAQASLRALLAGENWRPHLIGAVAVLLARDCPSELLWMAIGRQSWASPQLTAAASLIDPHFLVTARREMGRLVDVLTRPAASGSPALLQPAARTLASLAALVAQTANHDAWTETRLDGRAREAVERLDAESAGLLACRWQAAMTKQLEQRAVLAGR